VILTAALILLVSGCNSYELESDWQDREITIDGDDEEWDESRFQIEKEGIVAAAMNDAEFLYICIYPSDRQLSSKIMRQGLTLWLNTEGNKSKDLGVHFPLQNSETGFKKEANNDNPGARNNFIFETPDQVEILEPEENRVS
jgi:hypothetical protein